MNNLATQPAFEYNLKVLSGPEKGARFKILSPLIRIGRGNENDIVLSKDLKCSRNHVEIQFSAEGPVLKNVSERNKVHVNNKLCDEAILANGSVIKIGDSKIMFEIRKTSNKLSTSSNAGPMHSNNQHPVSTLKGRRPTFYIIIGFLALLLYLLFSDSNGNKKAEVELRNDATVQLEFEKNKKLIEAYNQENKRQKSSMADKQAQIAYLKGFREYKHGLYNRSTNAFQACLSLNPEHKLCSRYLILSERKFSELIEYKMILGNQYKNQLQYSECKKTFENIMYLVQDPTNKIFKEAKSNFDLCKTLSGGVF